jgi:hypothetical protein
MTLVVTASAVLSHVAIVQRGLIGLRPKVVICGLRRAFRRNRLHWRGQERRCCN